MINEPTGPKIINLSGRDLNETEIGLLKHGLKFTPTPKKDNVDLIADTDEFCRKLRLKEFFQNSADEDESFVRNKKGFRPPHNRDKHLEEYITCLKSSAISNNGETKINNNLPVSQQHAINNLQRDSTIIIKEADKGGAVVIMDKLHYREMVLNELTNSSFYRKLSTNEDRHTMLRVEKLIKKHAENLTKNEIDYLTNFEVKSSNFYGLPKIHKSKEIQDAVKNCADIYIKIPQPTDLKIRPIVAGPASSTQRLSNLLDIILKPLCELLPSYVRDDMDFLNYIPKSVDPKTILVSFDVISLYTNIPHTLGLEAINYWIDRHPNTLNTRFSKEFILEGLKLVLENNHFHFDEEFFLQTKGTAMGTKVAPTYATLVMGYLENTLFERTSEVFDAELSTYIGSNWKRYLDDCFIFWTKGEDDLEKFHSLLNTLNESIQFTMEKSDKELPFLDLRIIKNGSCITTDLYCKPTDTHQYLDFRSCHPSHTKRNIPFNLARRICTIITDKTLRSKRLEELKIFQQRQRYPKNLINVGVKRATQIPLHVLRNPRRSSNNRNNDGKLAFVVTHNPRNRNILTDAKRLYPILEQSKNMKKLLQSEDIISSQRQAPNLKHILTKARFTMQEEIPSVKKCGDPRCGTCAYIEEGNTILLKSGMEIRANSSMNCKSENVIYCAICPTCKEFYIGQTGKLNARVRVHKQQIKDPSVRNTPCCEHFAECGQGKFTLFPFYKLPNENEILRLAKEDHFIKLFKPKLNRTQ